MQLRPWGFWQKGWIVAKQPFDGFLHMLAQKTRIAFGVRTISDGGDDQRLSAKTSKFDKTEFLSAGNHSQ